MMMYLTRKEKMFFANIICGLQLNHSMFLEGEIQQKVFARFNNIFLIYLIKELQKYARNLILMMAFGGQTKIGQKIAAAGLPVLSSR